MSTTDDPFSPEAWDPFYVPDRTAEAVSFVAAIAIGSLVPVGLAVLPLRPIDLLIIFSMSLIAGLCLLRGMAARKHRLSRAKKVDILRASVLQPNDDGPSA